MRDDESRTTLLSITPRTSDTNGFNCLADNAKAVECYIFASLCTLASILKRMARTVHMIR
jgi:hypothetical protein